jgi:predicted PurR-regulated permease PerM
MNRSSYFQWWYQLTVPARLLMIGLSAPILVLNFWAMASISKFFGALIGIIVVASLLAFLLNYPVKWCVEHNLKREPASIIIFLLALSVLLGLGITLFPLAYAQVQQLAVRLPEWIESGRQQLIVLGLEAEERGIHLNLDVITAQIVDRLQGQIQSLTKSLVNLTLGTVSSLFESAIAILITTILTFYLLQHGDELWQSLIEWLPESKQKPISRLLRMSFQNYFIGQLILGICMASALIPTFLVLKVPFGLLFGLTIGTMALIPFGGTVGIISVTFLVALQNIWLGLKVLAAAAIVQQVLENLVAPRVLGSVTGLNPVWVFISVLVGAKTAGLVGVVIAVPMAVVAKTGLMNLRSRIALQDPNAPTQTDIAIVPAASEPERLSKV